MSEAKKASVKTRSILILFRDGSEAEVSDIPANAKITYGPVQPGKQDYGQENVVRIYTSTNNQLAVFRSVQSFRDLSLSVRQSALRVEDESEEISGPNGKTLKHNRSVRREWQ